MAAPVERILNLGSRSRREVVAQSCPACGRENPRNQEPRTDKSLRHAWNDASCPGFEKQPEVHLVVFMRLCLSVHAVHLVSCSYRCQSLLDSGSSCRVSVFLLGPCAALRPDNAVVVVAEESTKVISLDASSSEENKDAKCRAIEESVEGEDVPMACPPAVKVESTKSADIPVKKRQACDIIWGEHDGFGLCRGSNQLRCYFGLDGLPAQAGPCGRCDFCSSDALEALHDNMPQRITHLLSNIHGKPLQHAFVRIKIVLGEAAQTDYKMRRERVMQRRNPNRPKRASRKP